jgi:excisionase family DNA binding protein
MPTPATTDYTVTVELDKRAPTDADINAIHQRLDELSVSVAENLEGFVELTLTVPGHTLRQAVITAMMVAEGLGAAVTAVHATTQEIHDRRGSAQELPPVVSVPEAAELLKVTRQYVLQMIAEGKLPASKVARDYIIVKSALGPHMPAESVTG